MLKLISDYRESNPPPTETILHTVLVKVSIRLNRFSESERKFQWEAE